jgi:hypothetical protein
MKPSKMPEGLDFHVPEGREVFRIWEVARIIGHSRKQVEALISQGRFGKALKSGARDKAISRARLLRFLEENTH